MSLVNSAQLLAAQTGSPSLSQIFSTTTPLLLNLRFTNSRDLPRITKLFNGPQKAIMDPQNKIRARSERELAEPVISGSAVIAMDERDDIRFFGMASDHLHYGSHPAGLSEVGAVMCDVRGFGLAQVASAMLALRESARLRQEYPCLRVHGVHALVAKDNAPAQGIFSKSLQWGAVHEDHHPALFDVQGKYSCPDDRGSRMWFAFDQSASQKATAIVSQALARGHLSSRDSTQHIPLHIDWRALSIL